MATTAVLKEAPSSVKSNIKPAQINARIDPDLKAKGDAAFAAAGISPTDAIRALWRRAAELKDDPAALAALLNPSGAGAPDAEEESAMEKRRKAIEEGPHIVENALRAMGISPEKYMNDYVDDEALKEEAYLERFGPFDDEALLEREYLERYDPDYEMLIGKLND